MCLGECSFGHFPDFEIAVGNRLEETIKFALYGTFKHDDADSTFVFEEIGKNTTFASFGANYNPVTETGRFLVKNRGNYAEIDIYYECSPELREKGLIRFINEDEIELGFNMSYFEPRPKAWNEAKDIIKLRRIKE